MDEVRIALINLYCQPRLPGGGMRLDWAAGLFRPIYPAPCPPRLSDSPSILTLRARTLDLLCSLESL